jgi:hypothetical protein
VKRLTRLAAVTIGAALALSLAGCDKKAPDTAATTAPEAEAPPGEDPAGARTEGILDELFGSEPAATDSAQELADRTRQEEFIAQCMVEKGFEYTPVSQNATPEDPASPYDSQGTLEFAQQWGYGITTGAIEADNAALNEVQDTLIAADPNTEYYESLTDAARAAYDATMFGDPSEAGQEGESGWITSGCIGWAGQQVWGDDSDVSQFDALVEEMATLHESIDADPRVTEAVSEWASCMADAGHPGLVTLDDPSNAIEDRASTLLEEAGITVGEGESVASYADQVDISSLAEEEISMAVDDLTCRDQVDYDASYLKVSIEFQQEFYDTHKTDVDAYAEAAGDDAFSGW